MARNSKLSRNSTLIDTNSAEFYFEINEIIAQINDITN